MMRATLILAAHGAGDASAANCRLLVLAQQLAATTGFAAVVAAFHRGSPTYAEALDEAAATDVVVVPVMMSDGYYRAAVLPRGLTRSRRHGRVRVAITPALGRHPALPALVARRAQRAMRDQGLEPRETALVVVGHGAVRHPRSRAATGALRDALRPWSLCAGVEAAFLSAVPRVEDVRKQVAARNLVVIPFLIGGGYHARIDIPQRLGVDSAALASAGPAHAQDRRIVMVDPVGDDPAIGDLVRDLALRGYGALRARHRRTSA